MTTSLKTSPSGNTAGDVWSLNLGKTFDSASANFTDLFNSTPKAGGAANNIAPNYVDGTMFTNDDEYYLYGGLLRLTDSQSDPDADSVLGYEAFQYGPDKPSWRPGFYEGKLPNNVTRYVTNGAGVSIHSENLGFYFSGQRGPGWGPIHGGIPSANFSANTLISYDMSDMRSTKWTNTTLPGKVTPRANAELTWIPIATSGVLVAIGGVVNPEEIFVGAGLNDSQTKQSKDISPSFMTQIPVFDIVGGSWYLQSTTGDPPPQLAEFCSVVATAKDSSSFNIYIYGGYDGLTSEDRPSDDVWILSLPSFTWIKAYSGSGNHGRRGHKCHAVYPDQMFVVGGQNLDPTTCLDGGIIEVFNLNSLSFQDSYDPNHWGDYKVPSIVTGVIGGDVNGGAAKKFPGNSSGNEALADLFDQPYTKTIKPYYPYKAAASSSATPSTPPGITKTEKSSSGLPAWAGAVIGVLVGLIGISIIIFLVLWVRRRRRSRRSSYATSGTHSNTNRIMRWVNGMPGHNVDYKTDPSDITSEVDGDMPSPSSNPGHHGSTGSQPAGGYFQPNSIGIQEAAGKERYELQDASHFRGYGPFELPVPYDPQATVGGDRNHDFASGPRGGRSNSEISNPTSGVGGGMPPSTEASSPPLHPLTPDDIGMQTGTYSSMQSSAAPLPLHPRSPSPLTNSRGVSPDLNSHDNRGEPGSPTRPMHQRNPSSMSNQVATLPTPSAEETSPEEEERRSLVLEHLREDEEDGSPGPGPAQAAPREKHGSLSGSFTSGGVGDGGEVKRKKSSFTERV